MVLFLISAPLTLNTHTLILYIQLLATLAVWEESNGPFMYGGDRYCDRVALQDEHYIEVPKALLVIVVAR